MQALFKSPYRYASKPTFHYKVRAPVRVGSVILQPLVPACCVEEAVPVSCGKAALPVAVVPRPSSEQIGGNIGGIAKHSGGPPLVKASQDKSNEAQSTEDGFR